MPRLGSVERPHAASPSALRGKEASGVGIAIGQREWAKWEGKGMWEGCWGVWEGCRGVCGG